MLPQSISKKRPNQPKTGVLQNKNQIKKRSGYKQIHISGCRFFLAEFLNDLIPKPVPIQYDFGSALGPAHE
jgi:hypothetical protein